MLFTILISFLKAFTVNFPQFVVWSTENKIMLQIFEHQREAISTIQKVRSSIYRSVGFSVSRFVGLFVGRPVGPSIGLLVQQ